MNVSTKTLLDRFLGGEATIEEARQLKKLLKNDVACAQLSEEMDAELESLEGCEISDEMRLKLMDIYERINQHIKARTRRNRFLFAAAVIVPLFLLGASAYWINSRTSIFSNPEYHQVVTAYGEHTQVVFQDGTQVWLNGGTTMRYPDHFSLNNRKVKITGEAFFEVAKEHHRPFVVETPDGEISVKGTSFNIESYPEMSVTRITLKSGKIDFTAANKSYSLKPGEQLIFDRATRTVEITDESPVASATSWKDNMLCLEREPLERVIERLHRHYGAQFEVIDRQALGITFNYSSNYQSLNSILDDLELISPLKFTIADDKVLITMK